MVSTSKILTVSYGTFSCTLEGFDDSFETMKAIAEYFRDLAAEDRYFGAEPPVPDAEMLARIAEREIARRVEAREERGSIVLRAQPYGTVGAPLPQPPAAPTAAFAAAPLAQPTAETPQPAPTAPVPDAPAAVAPASAEVVAEDEDEDEDEDTGDWEDVAQATLAPALPAVPAVAPVAPDSVAAKLQRIRDVVSRSAAAPAPDPYTAPYTEDEHADSFLAQTASSIETALAEDDAADAPPHDADSDDIAALLSRLTGEMTAEAVAPAPADDGVPEMVPEAAAADHHDTAAFAPEPEAPDDDLIEVEIADDAEQDAALGAPLRARVIKMKRADFEAALAAGELVPEDEDDPEDEGAKEIIAKVIDDAQRMAHAAQNALHILPGSGLSPQEEEDLRRELAAVEAELVDIYGDTEDHADPRRMAVDDDDEDAYEDGDDLTSLFDEEEEEDHDPAADAATQALRDPREQLVKVRAEDDMSRLMAKTESAMTEPESANRRNAIAHLRAAVAATKAEQSAGTLPPRDPEATAFRDDLASVVRPRRPIGEAGPVTPRPPEARPAPLKLVAAQRVDLRSEGTATAETMAPVRPRRVSMAALPEKAATTSSATSTATAEATARAATRSEASEGGFAEFARSMGATDLPDVLEAAAAYLVHVEGRATFSRLQLMNKARQGSTDALSREDGLRAFGQLLRQGKILKLEGGYFTAAEDIGFKPAARRAG
jgi:pilus assembly protein FimV